MLQSYFKFLPSEKAIISEILLKTMAGQDLGFGDLNGVIQFAEVYESEPSELLRSRHPNWPDGEGFFLFHRQILSKNGNGKRPRRTLDTGWWRSSTGDRPIRESSTGNVIGFVKTLNFYRFTTKKKERNQATKTNFIMYEYSVNSASFEPWVFCRLKETPSTKGKFQPSGMEVRWATQENGSVAESPLEKEVQICLASEEKDAQVIDHDIDCHAESPFKNLADIIPLDELHVLEEIKSFLIDEPFGNTESWYPEQTAVMDGGFVTCAADARPLRTMISGTISGFEWKMTCM